MKPEWTGFDLASGPDETVEFEPVNPINPEEINALPFVKQCNELLMTLAREELRDRADRMRWLRDAAIMPRDFYDDRRYEANRAMAKDIARERDHFIETYLLMSPRKFIIRRFVNAFRRAEQM